MEMQNFPTQFFCQKSSRMTDLIRFWSTGYIVKKSNASQHFSFRKMYYRILLPSKEISLEGKFYTQFPKDYVDLPAES